MKSESFKLLLVITGAELFNIIFWHEKLAVNSILFDVFVSWSVFYLYPTSFTKTAIKWLLAARIITVAAVVIHNTVLSKIAFSITLLLVVVFTQYMHRSVWYAAGSAFMNYVLLVVPSFFANVHQFKQKKIRVHKVSKVARFLVIPLLLLMLFFGLYNFANSIFSTIIDDIGIAVQQFVIHIFDWVNWQRVGFILLGLLITGGLLLKSSISYFSEADINKHNDLLCEKTNLARWRQTCWFQLLSLLMGRFATGIMALRNENTTGIISLLLLNILLFFINCIDVMYVWFEFKYNNDMNLSQYVHEGIGMLIFSIILAMILVLFFFRGNLNFYKRNKWLRLGAYPWLIQNMVLVVSVLLRDYYYIAHMGLAYKRIGVLVFLLLALIGLITVFIKIEMIKTTYFLLKINAWIVVGILVVSSCFNWDEMIAEYNLARKNIIPLDIKLLLTLSDKTLPLLEANKDVFDRNIEKSIQGEGDYLYRSDLSPKEVFEIRKIDFLKTQNTYTWLSWNFADAYVKTQFSNIKVN